MYSISKKILFQNKLFIGDNIVSDGSFVIKKSAIKNIKKLNTVESAIEWINEPNFYVVSASTEKERAFLSSVSGVFKHEVYEFKRSKILLDRGENSLFLCLYVLNLSYPFWMMNTLLPQIRSFVFI